MVIEYWTDIMTGISYIVASDCDAMATTLTEI